MKRKLISTLFISTLLVLTGCNSTSQKTDKKPIANDSGLPALTYLDEPAVAIHFQKTSGSYKDWGLWMWSEGLDGAEYIFNYADDYGVIAYYPLEMFGNPTSLGFIVKQLFSVAGDGVWTKDFNDDRFLDFDVLKADDHQAYHCYLLEKKAGIYTDAGRNNVVAGISKCEFISANKIEVVGNKNITAIEIYRNGSKIEPQSVSGTSEVTITLAEAASVEEAYRLKITFVDEVTVEKRVGIRKLYDNNFDAQYNYDGELGAILDLVNNQTTFKVWSPVSSDIKLRIYNSGTPTDVDPLLGDDSHVDYTMNKGEKGVFSYTVSSNLAGKYYTYIVTNSSHPDGYEIVDPYAKSAGINGLRGMVVDLNDPSLLPTGWESMEYLQYDPKELTVYETHVADVTSSTSWTGLEENRYKFAGMIQKGTTYSDGVHASVSTGYDHIKELGVNAVQIIPIFDQANKENEQIFNWGYNPLNYNVVEGIYSKNPYDGYVRIKELRDLIKTFHDDGISIIMDVVYNHVNGLNNCHFDVLMPGYYFRYVELTGSASNGSGCGNETASNKYMFRKYMIDSTKFWTETYKLGGFRFDLMGLHDIETMNQLAAAVHEINPHAAIYGEPWTGGSSALPTDSVAAVQANANSYVGYGQFNDKFRDSMIAGGMSTDGNKGWITQEKYSVNPNPIVEGMLGITSGCTRDPNKTINYVTCHDNYTLHDRGYVAGIHDEDTLAKMNVLANSIVFSSQGITFMQAGEELLRTKIVYDVNGNPKYKTDENGQPTDIFEVSGNSYSSSYKTNELDYARKAAHRDMFTYYQKMIQLKQNLKTLHLNQEEINGKYSVSIQNIVEGNTYGSVITAIAKEEDATYYIYHANGSTDEQYSINIPAGASIYLDTINANVSANSTVKLHKFETLIYSVSIA